ncbi:MAG: hypothetical protein HRF45_01770 [Fimbriimonadia bacterium]
MTQLLAMLVTAAALQAGASPSPADLFPLTTGTSWLYEKRSNIASTVVGYGLEVVGQTELDGKPAWEVVTTDADKGGRSLYRADAKGVYLVAVGSPPTLLSPPMPLLIGPVKAGTKWSWSGEMPLSQGSIACKMEARVQGTERLLVLGKQEDCVKVETKSQLGSGKATISVVRTSWYAPGIGLVKEQTEYRDGKDRLTETVVLTRYSKS